MDLAAATRRVAEDERQLSLTGYYNDESSRTQHVPLSPEVYSQTQGSEMSSTDVSNHSGLITVFSMRSGVRSGEDVGHACKEGQCVTELVLGWKQERAHLYDMRGILRAMLSCWRSFLRKKNTK